MTKNPIVVGLDVGTYFTKIAVAKKLREEKEPSIIALGVSPTEGMRKGVVVDIKDVTRSIVIALESASKMIQEDITSVHISLNGDQIICKNTSGKVAVSRADGEVTEDDLNRVYQTANPGPSGQNKMILDIIPKSFTLDEETEIKHPVGMNGIRLELDAVLVESTIPPIKNLEKFINDAGLHILSSETAIITSSSAILTKKQKELGVIVIDMGAGTTSFAVYEEGRLIHFKILPIGSAHITSDIAIGMRIPVDLAEKVKIMFGYAMESHIPNDKRVKIDLSKINEEEVGTYSVNFLSGIIEARLKEIFSLISKDLREIGREGLLPAGVILVGGGANLRSIIDLAKRELKLPVKIAIPRGVEGSVADVDNPMFATLVGLLLTGFSEQNTMESNQSFEEKSNFINNIWNKIVKIFIPE